MNGSGEIIVDLGRAVRPTDAPPLFAALHRVVAGARAPAADLVLDSVDARGQVIRLGVRERRPGEVLAAIAARSFVPLLGDDEGEVLGRFAEAVARGPRRPLRLARSSPP